MIARHLIVVTLAGCSLHPLVSDIPPDTTGVPTDSGTTSILPPGTVVPSVSTNAALIDQIQINEGLTYATLMTNGGIVTRTTGKSADATVKYWNFGPATLETSSGVSGSTTIAVLAPLYVFGTQDGSGNFTPSTEHPPLIDTICGDLRYSAFRRVIDVPFTSTYAGQLITTTDALTDAINLGIVGTPVADGTWVNMPVVLPGLLLEVSSTVAPVPTQQVYGEGYLVDVFQLGTSLGRQPLKSGQVPIGQASSLLSGVASGSGVLSTTPDPSLVFQYAIPTTAPTSAPNYTPVTTTLTVQLATGVAPSAILGDSDLFTRSSAGAITGYYVDNVASYTVTTTTSNMQLQYTDGLP